ncbi:MAG TPA: YbaK/EbsC family protein [Acidimicrobiia bacterium]
MEVPAATTRFVSDAAAYGLRVVPSIFPEGTKTAADAAAAIGCDVAAIVKSLVFMADEQPVLVLMPGDLRVDTAKLAERTGSSHIRRAGLEEVRDATGYVAGGTPPIGHATAMPIYADPHLKRFSQVWAAAGTPTSVFPIALDTLISVTAAEWADLAEGE